MYKKWYDRMEAIKEDSEQESRKPPGRRSFGGFCVNACFFSEEEVQ